MTQFIPAKIVTKTDLSFSDFTDWSAIDPMKIQVRKVLKD